MALGGRGSDPRSALAPWIRSQSFDELAFYVAVAADGQGSRIRLGYALKVFTSPLFGDFSDPRMAGYLPEAAERLACVAEDSDGQKAGGRGQAGMNPGSPTVTLAVAGRGYLRRRRQQVIGVHPLPVPRPAKCICCPRGPALVHVREVVRLEVSGKELECLKWRWLWIPASRRRR